MEVIAIIIGQEPYCHFSTIQAGIDFLAEFPVEQEKRVTILSGTYQENVVSYLSNVTLKGLGDVRIIGKHFAGESLADGSERGTFRTATVFLEGRKLFLENLTIENQAGPGKTAGQAVALFNHGDQVTLKHCRLLGYQDTLCTGPLPDYQKDGTPFLSPLKAPAAYCRQAYEQCFIAGTIDFIFGGADARFTSCQLHSRCKDGVGYITAASTPKGQPSGYIFEKCYLTAEPGAGIVYLGRPWRSYAKTRFTQCFLGSHIASAGWDNWGKEENEQTAVYEEIDNYGDLSGRPAWIQVKERA